MPKPIPYQAVTGRDLILGWLFDVVEDQALDWALGWD
jgi:hypothetical protein